jgi:hypothetical protein
MSIYLKLLLQPKVTTEADALMGYVICPCCMKRASYSIGKCLNCDTIISLRNIKFDKPTTHKLLVK